jgi:hypothetical protein
VSRNASGPASVSATEGRARKAELDGSTSENNATTTQVKSAQVEPLEELEVGDEPYSANALTRAVFGAHRGNRMSVSATIRHRPHPVRAAGHPFNWRAILPVHPAAEAFPLLSEREPKELAGNIKLNGLKTKIVVWAPKAVVRPQLIDGRNRLDALALIGQLAVDDQGRLCTRAKDGALKEIVPEPIVGGDPEKHADSFNLHRRHLTAKQKRQLIAKVIKAQPEKSDRQIAEQARASPTTVGAVRRKTETESTVQPGQLPPKRVGKDGKARKQPAKKAQTTFSVSLEDIKKKARLATKAKVKPAEPVTAAVEPDEIDLFVSKLMKLDRDLARALELLYKGRYPVAEDLTLRLKDALGLDTTMLDAERAAAAARAGLAATELFNDLFGIGGAKDDGDAS